MEIFQKKIRPIFGEYSAKIFPNFVQILKNKRATIYLLFLVTEYDGDVVPVQVQ